MKLIAGTAVLGDAQVAACLRVGRGLKQAECLITGEVGPVAAYLRVGRGSKHGLSKHHYAAAVAACLRWAED
ncbi:hypothetical protein DGo_PB0205 (plasmid) [Deinococcus gobiensis I-0]|uniref:Uncharacterized protein n=1 Tax=Deinococcus gobiensis (strain DSM 21396 / JCM 16679 / CGMCC 1.7299 / I-0) TaxID=745776 RepID=H8H1S7_DEIGI|nr:hypothetical protein DGo_PB0205 [Deinococcus gobiensis I-0]